VSLVLTPRPHAPVVIGKSRIGNSQFPLHQFTAPSKCRSLKCDDIGPPLSCFDCGTILFQDFTTSPVVSFSSPRISKCRTPTPWDLAPHVPAVVNGSEPLGKSLIVISYMRILSLESPIVRVLMTLELLPCTLRLKPCATFPIFDGLRDFTVSLDES
jgi:hypothetical protein